MFIKFFMYPVAWFLKPKRLFIPAVEGINDSKPSALPQKFGRPFIRSMILHSAVEDSFVGGLPAVCMLVSVNEGRFATFFKVQFHLFN